MKTSLLALCVLMSAPVSASTLNFETFSNGDLISSVSSQDGLVSASLQVFGGAGEARALDTGLAATTSDLSGPFVNDTDSTLTSDPGRVLVVQESAATAAGIPAASPDGGKVILNFLTPVTFLGFSLYDNARIKLTSNTGLVATRSVTTSGAYNDFTVTGFENVTQLVFNFKGTSGALDNLRFADAASAEEPTPVPLPAGLPLALIGLGALGVMSRRRSR